MGGKREVNFFDFSFVPTFYSALFISTSFLIVYHNLLGDVRASGLLATTILLLSIYAIRRGVIRSLKGLENRGHYYIVSDYPRSERQPRGVRLLNACVPVVPNLRAIVVTKSLVETLDAKELASVIKHEEGHLHYNHAIFLILSLAVFFSTFHGISSILSASAKSMGYAALLSMSLSLAMSLLFINTTGRSLEREADHYAVANGYADGLKSALSKIRSKHTPNALARLFDPHPLPYARPGVVDVDKLSWHVKVAAPLISLMSAHFAVFLSMRMSSLLDKNALLLLIPTLFFTTFSFALLTTYVLLSMHRALGIKPWNSRIVILAYYLAALISLILELGPATFALVATLPPLIISRRPREYAKALIPFLLITALNLVALTAVYGLRQFLATYSVRLSARS